MSSTSQRLAPAILAAALLLAPASPLVAEGSDDLREHWEIEKYRWKGGIGDNEVIEVTNLLGDVRARLSENDQVSFSAITQRHDEDPHRSDFQVTEDGGRLRIQVAFVAPEGSDLTRQTADMEKRRVDLTILIPAGARLEARTERGLIEAKGLMSEVVASSTTGDVVVSIDGSVTARTERGKIQAILKNPEWDTAPRLETLTGNISLWLPNGTAALVHAETTGLITTDYSIEVESDPKSDHKTAVAKIGRKSRRRLSIHSVKGNVQILRLRG